jgi:hypothetical protein
VSFEPIVDDKLIAGKYVAINGINNSYHKHRLRNNSLSIYPMLANRFNSLLIGFKALFVAKERYFPVHISLYIVIPFCASFSLTASSSFPKSLASWSIVIPA